MSPPELSGSHLGAMERVVGGRRSEAEREKKNHMFLKGIFE